MKKIVNKETDEIIFGHGLDQVNNAIRYQKETSQGEVLESGILPCPNMWEAMDTYKVEQSDINLTGREVTYNFSTALIYVYNLLELDLEKWELK